ncbi:MAG: sigma-70 family RNA polymerase sigma factor [Myxococcales bacterium]|nr:sigma-70 family RNA polymerase sigma factor [Myxococcales bacterium]
MGSSLRPLTLEKLVERAAAPRLAKVVPLHAVPKPAVPSRWPSPAELVDALLSGEPEAENVLWDRYSTSVRAVLRRALGPRVEVEDALQEVFIRFFRALPGLREPSALGSFLTGIAVRVARGVLRKRRIKSWFRLTDDGELPELVEQDPAAERARRAVARLYVILDGLDDESRLLFVLRHIEELEIAEVAACLEISVATVKRRLARVTPVVFACARKDADLAAFMPSDNEEHA